MEYSNKKEMNENFKCLFCLEGEQGIGKGENFVCFSCIKELVYHHDLIVKSEYKIKPFE